MKPETIEDAIAIFDYHVTQITGREKQVLKIILQHESFSELVAGKWYKLKYATPAMINDCTVRGIRIDARRSVD